MSVEQDEHGLTGDYEDPLSAPAWVIGIAGTAVLIAIILGVWALAYGVRYREAQRISVDQPIVELERLRADQRGRLVAGPHRELRSDSEDGQPSIVIPLEEAMRLVAEEHRQHGGGR